MDDNEKKLPEQKKRDWSDTASKLLIPILIFVAGAALSYQKDKSDQANKEFQLESEVLKQATSKDPSEKNIGLIRIRILQKRGIRIADEMQQVVEDQDRLSPLSTQNAHDILVHDIVASAKQNETGPPSQDTRVPRVYIQIANESQRSDANQIADKLKSANFTVENFEVVETPTQNTYVRYFSTESKQYADTILQTMRDMGFKVDEQGFTKTQDKSSSPSLSLEIWLGEKQKPLTHP